MVTWGMITQMRVVGATNARRAGHKGAHLAIAVKAFEVVVAESQALARRLC